MDEIVVCAIRPEDLPAVWPAVSKVLGKVEKYTNGEYTLEDIYVFIEEGEDLLFVIYEGENILGAATARLTHHPSRLVCHFITCAGEKMDLWLDKLFDAAAPLIRAHKVDAVYIYGRPGWDKILPKREFKKVYHVYERIV